MWKENVLLKKSKKLKGEEVLSKEVLFKRTHTQSHAHPAFKAAGEMARYDRGMSAIAMAILDEDWKKLCAREIDDKASKELFAKIEKETLSKVREIERQLLGKAKNGRASINLLARRLNTCKVEKQKSDKTFDMDKYVLQKVTGEETGSLV